LLYPFFFFLRYELTYGQVRFSYPARDYATLTRL